MNDTSPDPFDMPSAPGPAAPFAIGYKRAVGEGTVYGAILFAFGFLILGLFGGAQVLVSLSLIPIFIAYWHYPMIDRGQPQLGANAEGLFLERLGFLRWDAISRLDLVQTSVRSIQVSTLKIGLHCPLEDALAKPQIFPFWKSVMVRNWKTSKPAADGSIEIKVELHPLNADPEEVLARLRRFRPV